MLFLKAKVPGYGSVTIGGVYRPPCGLYGEFLSIIDGCLTLIQNSRCIIAGDFNLDLMNPDIATCDYIDLMSSFGYSNGITSETYVSQLTNEDKSCLDHMWCNFEIKQNNYIIYPNLSDHYCIAAVFSKSIDCVPIKIKFRDFSAANRSRLLECLSTEFSSYNPPNHNIDFCTRYLLTFLKSILDEYFPIKEKTYSQKRLRAPWLTGDVMKCITKSISGID